MNSPPASQVIERMGAGGIIAVIRADSSAQLIDAAAALAAGGVQALEVTLTTPGALGVIEEVLAALADRCLIGAGTVLDAQTARAAILAGAQYIVSPIVDLPTIRMCRRYDRAVVPGAFSPTWRWRLSSVA